MSTLSVNNITTQNGNIITVPSGKVFASPGLPIQTVLGQDETGMIINASSLGINKNSIGIIVQCWKFWEYWCSLSLPIQVWDHQRDKSGCYRT